MKILLFSGLLLVVPGIASLVVPIPHKSGVIWQACAVSQTLEPWRLRAGKGHPLKTRGALSITSQSDPGQNLALTAAAFRPAMPVRKAC